VLMRDETRFRSWMRSIFAVLCGVIAGAAIPNSLAVGFKWLFPMEPDWGPFLWEEHWILRPVASVLAAAGAGFVAGAIARHHGRWIAVCAAFPALLLWAYFGVSAWQEQLLFSDTSMYVSIGNKLAITLIVAVLLPVAWFAGVAGEELGADYAVHFDSSSASLLGIKWYHFLWIPIVLHFVIAQFAWAGLYGFEWMKMTWRAGPTLGSLLPSVFVMMIWGTFMLMFHGLVTAYKTLSGIDAPKGSVAGSVVRHAVGLPLLAGILQVVVMALHAGLVQLMD
jgi:hypothetical protein